MANGAFNFKDGSGNIVSFISGSGSDIIISGGTLDLSSMTGLTLGNLTMEGTVETASFAPSYLLTSSFNSYTGTTDNIIGSLQTSTSSLNSFTSSTDSRLDTIEGVTGSYATTGSNTFNGNLTVTGYIDAQELRTTYISSSILYRSGSTKFGDELTDNHEFTGSLLISGSSHHILGSLGVDVITPSYKLDVNSGTTNVVARFESTDGTAAIMLKDNSGNVELSATGNSFSVQPGGGAAVFTVGSDGNSTFSKTDDTRVYITDTTDNSTLVLRADLINEIYTDSANDLQIYTNGNQNGQIYLKQSTGKVGVGSTNPDEKLHVNGNVAAINSSYPTFKVQGSDVNYQGRMRWDTNNNVLEFLTRHAGTYYSDTLVLKEGKIGVGTNNPTSLLHLSGTAPNIHFDDTSTTGTRNRFQLVVGDVGTTQSGIFSFNNTTGTSLLEVLTVNELGRIGIGINNPSTDFHISSANSNIVRITTSGVLSSGYYDAFQLLAGNQTGGGLSLNIGKAESTRNLGKMVYFHTSDGSTSNRLGFGFYDADGLFNVLAGGTIGAGVTNPTSRFEVQPSPTQSTLSTLGVSVSSAINVRIPNVVGDVGQIVFTNEAAPNYGYGSIGMVMTSGTGVGLADFIISTKPGGGDVVSLERFRINSSGYITSGGATSAAFQFHVGPNLGGASLKYLDGTSKTFNDTGIGIIGDNDATNTSIDNGIFLANNSSQNGAYSPIISFAARSSSTNYNHAYASIYGIKTDNGADTNWNRGDLILATSVGTGPRQVVRVVSTGTVWMGEVSSNGGNIASYNGWTFNYNGGGGTTANFSNSNEIFTFNQRDGAGTTQIDFRNGNVERGRIEWTTAGTTYNTSSDYRLKTNVNTLTGALEKVLLLSPKTFNYIDNGDTIISGFIAHEVQEIVPEAVTGQKDEMREDGTPKYQGMDHSRIVPILVGAIQEQQTIIEDLKSRLETLENN